MPSTILLLTAAIEPSPDMKNNLRSDHAVRRKDYLDALRFYIDALLAHVTDILFCDNSGADLTEFEQLMSNASARGRKLHLMAFKGETPVSKGKGVCEFEILDRACDWLGKRFAPDAVVWKVTGRLQIKNIAALIHSRPDDADLYVDMRSVPLLGERLGGNDWAEMRVMCFRLVTYARHLAGMGESFGYVTEKGLFRHLMSLRQGGTLRFSPRFRIQPRFRGICGGSNKNYEGLEYQAKDGLRIFARSVIPSLWL